MVRTRSIWFACITVGVLLVLLAAGRASARPPEAGPALPGPAHAWTWQNPLPQGNDLIGPAAAGDVIWTAGGTEALSTSADRGATWAAHDLDANQTINALVMDVPNAGRTGWALVQMVDAGGGELHAALLRTTDYWRRGTASKTTDGGVIWEFLPESAPSQTLFDLRMWSDGTGYVTGQFGTIMKTETGGRGVD